VGLQAGDELAVDAERLVAAHPARRVRVDYRGDAPVGEGRLVGHHVLVADMRVAIYAAAVPAHTAGSSGGGGGGGGEDPKGVFI
jgi:hypothetical protein